MPTPPNHPPQESTRLLGESPAIRDALRLIDRVANADATILITGESGTGKEVAARELHQRSGRSAAPFVAVNCASIPANLLEAELFGYERGAFTDAKIQKKGLLELAHGGTLFLDEIGLMPFDLQAKLLSVLESRNFRRVGGVQDFTVNVRFLAATNEDLERAVADGRFRQDLFYRLNVIPLTLPPLKERVGDVTLLARHFLAAFGERYGKPTVRFSDGARRWLINHSWPGNVRELRNVVERAVLLGAADEIQVEDLALGQKEREQRILETGPAVSVGTTGEIHIQLPPWGIALEDVERQMIMAALEATDGNVSKAAPLLHLSRDTLRYRIRKHRLASTTKEETRAEET